MNFIKLHIKSKTKKRRNLTPFISVVVPAYNESARISSTLAQIDRYLTRKRYSYEIIVVDDGSKDKTANMVEKFARRAKNIYLIKNQKNIGKGYSVRRGMLHASGRIRLFMDADNSVDIFHIDKSIRWLERGYEVVIGSINIGESKKIEHNGAHRRFLGSMATYLIRALATPKIKDTQRGFKVFSARAAKKIFSRQTIERFGFDIEILVIAQEHGFRIKEIPVIWDNPEGSAVTLRSYLDTMMELFSIAFGRIIGRYSS